MDRITANLPAKSIEETSAFYERLGFVTEFKDDGWLIMKRGALVLEFFPHPEVDPYASWFSACIRVDDLDGLFTAFQTAGLTDDCRAIPRLTPPVTAHGMRIFALIDLNGSLLRCIDNRFNA